ncbi:MAG TPA: oligosaccharide flippase family protein [Anaerolineales bacterium]|nr:oligosaccharide flippase family protein [Anaerolineales bacterium]
MRSLAPNSLILTASNILNAILGFSLSFIIGRGLGESSFGIWVFSLAWASILTMICEFGLNSFITREASRVPENLNRLLFLSLVIKLTLISIFGGGVWFFAPILALDVPSSAMLRVSLLIAVVGLAYGSFTAIFRSAGWMSPILWLNLIGGITQLAWSMWIIRSGGNVLSLIWVALAIDFGQLIVAVLLWWNRLRVYGGALKILLLDVTQMARDTLPFAISGFFGAIEARLSILLLGYIRNETEVGRFGMASRFFEAARLIPNGIYDAVFPVFAAQNSGTNKVLFQRLLQVILIYTAGVTLVLILFSHQVIQLTYGESFILATPTLSWLGIALLPTLHNSVMEVYLFATGDEKYATKLGFFGLAVQILASTPLMYFYGAPGAAIGVLISELVIWLPLRRRIKNNSL